MRLARLMAVAATATVQQKEDMGRSQYSVCQASAIGTPHNQPTAAGLYCHCSIHGL